jgi:predicted ATPase
MIEAIEFQNFKVLKDARLPLGAFTLLVGANGTGKSTALQAIEVMQRPGAWSVQQVLSASARNSKTGALVRIRWPDRSLAEAIWRPGSPHGVGPQFVSDVAGASKDVPRMRVYRLLPDMLATPTQLESSIELRSNGDQLAGVMDRMRDESPERFEALNRELQAWLPEYDRVLFAVPGRGLRSIELRTRNGGYSIHARDLSDGTLLALALLTIAYLEEPPPLIGIEEPDHGIHPRLLRRVKDALYRLAYPKEFGDAREPVQVLATTHSPYFLDLFRDHPEEIVITRKEGDGAVFDRLVDRADITEILEEAPLGEVWYSGILGGVPIEQ